MKALHMAAIILLAMIGCASTQASPASGIRPYGVTVWVENGTVYDLAIYIVPSTVRVGSVRGMSGSCLTIRGSGDVLLYAIPFASDQGFIVAPRFSYQLGDGWRWTVRTVVHDLAPDLVPAVRCDRQLA